MKKRKIYNLYMIYLAHYSAHVPYLQCSGLYKLAICVHIRDAEA